MEQKKLSRLERKARAAKRSLEIWNKISEEYTRLEKSWIRKDIAFKDLLILLNSFIEAWIKRSPEEAHLIRQETVKFSKVIIDVWEDAIKLNQNEGR